MPTTTSTSPTYIKRVRTLLIAVGIVFLVCFCLFGSYLDPFLTYMMGPSVYPNSTIVSEKDGGGSGGTRRTTVYYTNDNIQDVYVFLNSSMPGFKGNSQEGYYNDACNESTIAKASGWIFVSQPYSHCIGVDITPASPSGTTIKITAEWPSG